MKLLVMITIVLGSFNAFAGPAMCGKYSATIAETGEAVTITSQVSEYVNEPGEFVGYGTINTYIEAVDKTDVYPLSMACNRYFVGEVDEKACGYIAVTNVKLVDDVDCWGAPMIEETVVP